MIGGLAGRTFHRLWRSLPYSMRLRMVPHILDGIAEHDKLRIGHPTVEGLLQNMRACGFAPGGIVDVGANVGNWSRMAQRVFPGVPAVMFDGNPEMDVALRETVTSLGSHTRHAISLLGPEPRADVAFHTVGSGSGVLPELTTFPKVVQHLSMSTLDTALAGPDVPLTAPLLLKLDVQGYELEVLRGAAQTLQRTEVTLLETSLMPYNEGAPTFADVVRFMEEAGFVVYDFCGQFRRETDHALFQTDVAFVRPDSPLRRRKKFWLNEP